MRYSIARFIVAHERAVYLVAFFAVMALLKPIVTWIVTEHGFMGLIGIVIFAFGLAAFWAKRFPMEYSPEEDH